MFNPAFADAIAKIESGGNYGILGPVTKSGDRAYGKYQVMGANIPVWTKEILGAPMTPEEFRTNPQAQDAVFQGKFGQYVEKYGPEGAAQAWFAGPGGVGKFDRTDQLGTSVGDYGKKFMAGIGEQPIQQPVGQPLDISPPVLGVPKAAPTLSSLANFLGPSPQAQAAPMATPAPLNAPPPMQQALNQINMLKAFSKIPTPAGFKGFRYS
jgi:hypothetical protein